jgi:glucokinase
VSSAVVGLDLGGTKVAAASLRDGELGESVVRPTSQADGQVLLDELVAVIRDAAGGRLDAVGVGVPSIVEFETGRVISSVNVPLVNIPLRQVLGERLGVPVFVDNDANVAALAEAHDEELRPVTRHLVMLTVGTGIGGGIVVNGRIYRGATGGAGELGHTIVGLNLSGSVPAPDGFPQPGSLESVASGHALDRMGSEVAEREPGSALGRLHASGRAVLGSDVVDAARGGDPVALRTLGIWGEHVGIGVANAINAFDPEEVVIGGGGALAGELLLEPASRVARNYVVPGLVGRTVIRLARHGLRAGVLGAAMLALGELELGDARRRRSNDKREQAVDRRPLMTMRVVECNICGEPLAAANDEELLGRMRVHVETEHPDSGWNEDAARGTVVDEAYDAADS